MLIGNFHLLKDGGLVNIYPHTSFKEADSLYRNFIAQGFDTELIFKPVHSSKYNEVYDLTFIWKVSLSLINSSSIESSPITYVPTNLDYRKHDWKPIEGVHEFNPDKYKQLWFSKSNYSTPHREIYEVRAYCLSDLSFLLEPEQECMLKDFIIQTKLKDLESELKRKMKIK